MHTQNCYIESNVSHDKTNQIQKHSSKYRPVMMLYRKKWMKTQEYINVSAMIIK